ncbi:MAG: hypothetical protein ACFFKA_15545, partial [Candidatus Thorarchaeota archaeon]
MIFSILSFIKKKFNYQKKTKILLILLILSLLMVILSFQNIFYSKIYWQNPKFNKDVGNLSSSASDVNGKPLTVFQHANISKIHTDVSSSENISFPLLPDWTSKNTTIYYEGVNRKNVWTTNGDFLTNTTGWNYVENDNVNGFGDIGWANFEGTPAGCTYFSVRGNTWFNKGLYARYQQNFTIFEELSNKNCRLSFNYYYDDNDHPNASVYMGIIINGVEKNYTLNFEDGVIEAWSSINMEYNPVSFGQTTPGNVTVFVGMYINEYSYKANPAAYFFVDSIEFTLWTQINDKDLINSYDVSTEQNNAYFNTTFGIGYAFIDVERTTNITKPIIFTVYENLTGKYEFIDFSIDFIIIYSFAIKTFNSSYSNKVGSFYSEGETITWDIEFEIKSFPTEYTVWVELEKPFDWSLTSIVDTYSIERLGECLGTGYSSTLVQIPINAFGLWKLKAISANYITEGYMSKWDEDKYINESKLSMGDIFLLNITLNDTLVLENTIVNYTIYFPNATIFLEDYIEPTSHNFKIGNFTIGDNMTVGNYDIEITWSNNQSYLNRDKVGYFQLLFTIWHHTNLTAVNSFFELTAGDPLLLKVKFSDYDLNESIHFANLQYNSSYGISGTLIYIGSGIYFIDLDTSTLDIGEYYFSFNASKMFYENKTAHNLIYLKVITQNLALEVPHSTIQAYAYSVASCRVNVTGAISKSLIWPINLTTDWFNPYNITDNDNGTYTLDFSTDGVPNQGEIESYTISISANKTGFGDAIDYITILVLPISTIVQSNSSLISINQNEVIIFKANYTVELSNELIAEANCNITWVGSYIVTPGSDGYYITLYSDNLATDYYSVLIKFEKAG